MDWFIADTHFFHARVIQYSKRPWETSEDMTEGLIRNWNARVAKNDRIFVLGDFAFGNKTLIRELVPRLNGKKMLVKGNHDNNRGTFYVEAGFASTSHFPVFYTNPAQGITERFLLSHEPIFPTVGDLINIHGHLHDGVNPAFYAPQHICVSAEMVNYRPISLPEIMAKLKEKNDNFTWNADTQCHEYDARGDIKR